MTSQSPLPSLITEEEFLSLSPSQQNLWIYKTISPIATEYTKARIIRDFGVGLGGIIFSIVSAGGGIFMFLQFIRDHLR